MWKIGILQKQQASELESRVKDDSVVPPTIGGLAAQNYNANDHGFTVVAAAAAAAAENEEAGAESREESKVSCGGVREKNGPVGVSEQIGASNAVVDFSTRSKVDYAAAKVSGKKANRNGSILQPETVVCRVTPPFGGGRCFKLRALVRSFLLEANERLQFEPELLHKR
jgi:hypothetical protein